MTTAPQELTASTGKRAERDLALICLGTFFCVLNIGLPLAVLPLYVHQQLGYGPVVVGATVGIQFLATILSRGLSGRLADQQGGRRTMLTGLAACALVGLFYLACSALPLGPAGALALLVGARLALGLGESLLISGCLAWGIGSVGPARSGKVMAWCGMAIYGALAIGASLGLLAYAHGGLAAIGVMSLLLPGVALLLVHRIAATAPVGGQRSSLLSVLARVWQPGLALALQGVGFATISAFISLYFASRQWEGAGLALTAFGLAFALARVVGGHLPDQLGGPRVALGSFVIETLGLLALWLAPTPGLALAAAAVAGFGSSLIFPALGLVVVQRVEPQVRATALGGYAAFQDLAYGLTGPITGTLVGSFGYQSTFLVGAIAAFAGLLLTLRLLTGRQT